MILYETKSTMQKKIIVNSDIKIRRLRVVRAHV
jgi:hypothetical protein